MNKIEIAYNILYNLEYKDKKTFMGTLISPKKLNVSDEEWLETVEDLIDEGYVKGIIIREDIIGNKKVNIENARITLKGSEYLHENSVMKKMLKIATNVISISKNI